MTARTSHWARAKSEAAASATAAEAPFDYGASAELFPTRLWRSGRPPFGYRRFARAADAIRFAIEDLPPDVLLGAYLEVDEARFDSEGIRRLYERADYPLSRRAAERERGSGAATSKVRAAVATGTRRSKKRRAAARGRGLS